MRFIMGVGLSSLYFTSFFNYDEIRFIIMFIAIISSFGLRDKINGIEYDSII